MALRRQRRAAQRHITCHPTDAVGAKRSSPLWWGGAVPARRDVVLWRSLVQEICTAGTGWLRSERRCTFGRQSCRCIAPGANAARARARPSTATNPQPQSHTFYIGTSRQDANWRRRVHAEKAEARKAEVAALQKQAAERRARSAPSGSGDARWRALEVLGYTPEQLSPELRDSVLRAELGPLAGSTGMPSPESSPSRSPQSARRQPPGGFGDPNAKPGPFAASQRALSASRGSPALSVSGSTPRRSQLSSQAGQGLTLRSGARASGHLYPKNAGSTKHSIPADQARMGLAGSLWGQRDAALAATFLEEEMKDMFKGTTGPQPMRSADTAGWLAAGGTRGRPPTPADVTPRYVIPDWNSQVAKSTRRSTARSTARGPATSLSPARSTGAISAKSTKSAVGGDADMNISGTGLGPGSRARRASTKRPTVAVNTWTSTRNATPATAGAAAPASRASTPQPSPVVPPSATVGAAPARQRPTSAPPSRELSATDRRRIEAAKAALRARLGRRYGDSQAVAQQAQGRARPSSARPARRSSRDAPESGRRSRGRPQSAKSRTNSHEAAATQRRTARTATSARSRATSRSGAQSQRSGVAKTGRSHTQRSSARSAGVVSMTSSRVDLSARSAQTSTTAPTLKTAASSTSLRARLHDERKRRRDAELSIQKLQREVEELQQSISTTNGSAKPAADAHRVRDRRLEGAM